MIIYSPAMWAWTQQLQADAVAVDERCVNEGAKRADGSFCREKAEPNGWCEACWSEIVLPTPQRGPTGLMVGLWPKSAGNDTVALGDEP